MEETTGQDPIQLEQDSAGATTEQAPAGRTYSESEMKAVRDEAASRRRELRDLQTRLQQIEDAQKPELQRLTDAAGRVPLLEKDLADRDERLSRYEAAFQAQNDQARKLLDGMDKGLLTLIPDGLSPDQEFICLRNALNKAHKDREDREDREKRAGLPPSGGRNPGTGSDKKEPTDQERQAAQAHYAARW